MTKKLPYQAALPVFLFALMLTCNLMAQQQRQIIEQPVDDREGETVERARTLYSAGHYKHSLAALQNYQSLSRRNRFLALDIMVKNHIELNEPDAVYRFMDEMLRQNPVFDPATTSTQDDFLLYYNKFDVLPLFTVGLRSGISRLSFRKFSTGQFYSPEIYNKSYSFQTGSTLGLNIGLHFNHRWSLEAFPQFASYGFTTNTLFGETEQTVYQENFSMVDLPVALSYKVWEHSAKKLAVYVKGGVVLSRLTNTEADIRLFSSREEGEISLFNKFPEASSIDRAADRNRYLYSVTGGIEVARQIKRFRVGVMANFIYGINDFNINYQYPSASNEDLAFYFYQSESRYRTNAVALSLSGSYTFYRVKRKFITR